MSILTNAENAIFASNESVRELLIDLRDTFERFRDGTKPRTHTKTERLELRGIHGTLAVVLSEIDKRLAATEGMKDAGRGKAAAGRKRRT